MDRSDTPCPEKPPQGPVPPPSGFESDGCVQSERPRSAPSSRGVSKYYRRHHEACAKRPADVPRPVYYHPSHESARSTTESPGPVRYAVELEKSHIGGAIPLAERFYRSQCMDSDIPTDSPGPAVYNSSLSHRDTRMTLKFLAGRRQPLNSVQDNPGPGRYSPSFPAEPASPKVSFSKGLRDSGLHSGASPGPGEYQSCASAKHGPAWHIGGTSARRLEFETAQHVYATQADGMPLAAEAVVRAQGSGAAFCKAARVPKGHSNGVPGPGAYNSLKGFNSTTVNHPGVSFAKSQRKEAASSRLTQNSTGTHNVDVVRKVRGGAFPQASRDFDPKAAGGDGHSGDTPGPAEYSVGGGESFTRRRPRSASFLSGRHAALHSTSETPAPNTYTPSEARGGAAAAKGASVGHALRTSSTARDGVPGPGSYLRSKDDKRARGTPKWVASHTSTRDPFGEAGLYSRDVPGPGYKMKGNSGGSSVTFPKDKRGRNHVPSRSPGPASYCPSFRHVHKTGGAAALLYLTG